MEGSIKVRRQREEKDKLMEGSMRIRRQKEKDIDVTEGSVRARRPKEEKDGDVEGSERRKKQREEVSRMTREEGEAGEKEKTKDGRKKLTSSDASERWKKKGGSIKRRMKKLASSLRKKRELMRLLSSYHHSLLTGKMEENESSDRIEKTDTREKMGICGSIPTDAQKSAFESFIKEVFEMGVDGLIKQYAVLKPYVAANYAREIFDKYPTKNRYKDVICNDITRVSIKDGKGSDYIHANYVRGDYLQNTFICTQGPITATIYDFWRMIVSEHVTHIVMLCETVENGKMKCEQYWPAAQGEKLGIEDFVLTNIRMNSKDSHVTRTTIEIQRGNDGHKHLVKHHQWKTWPDKTVPKSLLAVFRILHVVRSSSNPIVVHCSAGIGRTGSMVAIEMCLQTLLAGQKLNMLETCKKLRDQRMHSVQVEVQYVYVAEALCEFGKAMGFWSSPELLEQYTKFKTLFDDYVSRLPVPGAAAPQQAVPAPDGLVQIQQGSPVLQKSPCHSPMPVGVPQQIASPVPLTPPRVPPLTKEEVIPKKNVKSSPPPPLASVRAPVLPDVSALTILAKTAHLAPIMPKAAPRQAPPPQSVREPPRVQQVAPQQRQLQSVRGPTLVRDQIPGQPQAPQLHIFPKGGLSPQQPPVSCATGRAAISPLSLRR